MWNAEFLVNYEGICEFANHELCESFHTSAVNVAKNEDA